MRRLFLLIAVLVLATLPCAVLHAQEQPAEAVIELASPPADSVINGSHVEVAVRFLSAENRKVTLVKVFLDDAYITQMAYETAIREGGSSFTWDTNRTPNGRHRLEVRLFSGDEYLGSTTGDVYVSNKPKDLAPPRVAVMSPQDGAVVSGVVPIIIEASDNSGIEPMVNVSIDKSLRSVKNRAPYEYTWDTTNTPNGPHTIDISAEDDARNPASARTIRVTVRNLTTTSPVMINASTAGTTPLSNDRPAAESARVSKPREQSFEVKPAVPVAKALGSKTEMGLPSPSQTLVAKAEPLPGAVVKAEPKPAATPTECCPGGICTAAKPTEKLYESSVDSTCPIADVHTVKQGDNLYAIARANGVTVDAIVRMNDIKDASKLSLGMKLRIPPAPKMIAVRPVFEAAGGSLTWESGRKAVRAVCPEHDVLLRIGSAKAVVNASPVKMDKAAVVTGGRTMVPESFVTSQLGMSK